jgi:hypothetical protein
MAAPTFLPGQPTLRFSRKPKSGKGDSSMRASAPEAEAHPAQAPQWVPIFAGLPAFQTDQAVLFDSSTTKDRLPSPSRLQKLRVSSEGKATNAIDPGLMLCIFIGDLVLPRAKASLADVLAQGGERPLNLLLGAGKVLLVTLHRDPSVAWPRGVTGLSVWLECMS